ncbi:calcium-binding protein, partial [Qipengyuania vulgaris]|uniref:calcium-binding protein n=1 Tax=Qipengyuania vulgaris TaxID=291985 RepID=UPI00136B439F
MSSFIQDTPGDDVVYGTDGNDQYWSESGNDTFYGRGGDDTFIIHRAADREAELNTVYAGAGDDYLDYQSDSAGRLVASMGAGADRVYLSTAPNQGALISLGEDQDILEFSFFMRSDGIITVTDFGTGDSGDRIEWSDYLERNLENWNGSDNPFGSGYLNLVQDGPDTMLQIDRSGSGTSFETLVRFEGTSIGEFTFFNFDGFPPDGSAVPGKEITGTSDDDALEGSSGADTISGLDGNDRISGSSGNDVLDGGDGDDFIDDGAGDDVLRGGEGNDYFQSFGGGSDTFLGGSGDDWFTMSGSGSDFNQVYAGAGDDYLALHGTTEGRLVANMGGGADRVFLGSVPNQGASISLGGGQDELELGFTPIVSQTGALVVSDFSTGDSGDRLEMSDLLNRYLSGWTEGENPFRTGHLRLTQSNSDVLLELDRDGLANSFVTIGIFQNVVVDDFTAFNLDGFAPDGSGTQFGTEENDYLEGTPGSDILFGEGKDDLLFGRAGDDTLYGGAGWDTLDGGGGNDLLNGGNGNDRASYLSAWSGITVSLALEGAQNTLGSGWDTLISIEHLTGSAHADVLTGSAGNNQIFGDGGSDTIFGGFGDDLLLGQDGDDVIEGQAGWDMLRGDDGNDTLIGGNGGDMLLGGDGIDTLSGNSGFDRIYGGSGGDIISGGADRDLLFGEGGDDTISGDGGNDLLQGHNGEDVLDGGAGNDVVNGGAGNDTLLGGDGDDILIGNWGIDTMTGGTGADTFLFKAGHTGSYAHLADTILDFSQADGDIIDLSQIDALAGGGDDAFA